MGIPAPTSANPATGVPPAGDQANAVVTTAHGAQGAGKPFAFFGPLNFSLSGVFVATVTLERSFDGGTTWIGVCPAGSVTPVSLTAVASMVLTEPERGVLYRSNCTAWTSGTATARLSGNGPSNQTIGGGPG